MSKGWSAPLRACNFLVLDELHTYRGRQGADVALLVRRIRDACAADRLQCIGTSATLASGGTFDEQQAEVAAVASRLFGSSVRPERVLGETLRRVTAEPKGARDAALDALAARVRDKSAPAGEPGVGPVRSRQDCQVVLDRPNPNTRRVRTGSGRAACCSATVRRPFSAWARRSCSNAVAAAAQ